MSKLKVLGIVALVSFTSVSFAGPLAVARLCHKAGLKGQDCHVYVNCSKKIDINSLHSEGWEGGSDPIPKNGGYITDPGVPLSTGNAVVAEIGKQTKQYVAFEMITPSSVVANQLFIKKVKAADGQKKYIGCVAYNPSLHCGVAPPSCS